MLINTLNKKYLAEEVIQQQPPPPPPPILTSGSSDDSNSMEVAYDQSNAQLDAKDQQQMEDDSLKELEELFCATCGDVHTSLRNQLVECCDCHLLYHQDCHKPAIIDAEAKTDWQCSKCRCSVAVAESVLTSSSSSSSSPTVFATTKTSSSSSPHSSSSSSKSGGGGGGGGGGHRKSGGGGSGSGSKSSGGGGGSSSKSGGSGGGGGSGGNSGNVLSADKRLANMKKKAAKMQKTK